MKSHYVIWFISERKFKTILNAKTNEILGIPGDSFPLKLIKWISQDDWTEYWAQNVILHYRRRELIPPLDIGHWLESSSITIVMILIFIGFCCTQFNEYQADCLEIVFNLC